MIGVLAQKRVESAQTLVRRLVRHDLGIGGGDIGMRPHRPCLFKDTGRIAEILLRNVTARRQHRRRD